MKRLTGVLFTLLIIAQPSYGASLLIMDQRFGETVGIKANDNNQVLVDVRSSVPNPLVIWNTNNNSTVEIKPLPGYTKSNGTAINNLGAVAGFSSRPQIPHSWAFIWTKEEGTVALPTVADDWASNAYDLNENQVVGFTLGNGVRPVVWTKIDGEWTVEELPRTTENSHTEARTISPNGLYIGGTERGKPVIWTKTNSGWEQKKIFDEYATIFQINDDGVVVGNINEIKMIGNSSVAVKEAFIWELSNSRLKRLGFVGRDYISTARSFNKNSQIVGMSQTSRDMRAFLWTSTSGMRALNIGSGYSAVFAESINAGGSIVGTLVNGSSANSVSRAFFYKQ